MCAKRKENPVSGRQTVPERQTGGEHVRRAVLVCLLLLVLVLALVCVAIFCLRIREVSFSGSSHYSEEELFSATGLTLGKSMYRIDKEQIRASVLRSCPYVRAVTIRRVLPDKLEVTLEEYEAHFYTEIGTEYFVFLDDLRVLERIETPEEVAASDLIRVTFSGGNYAVVGETLGFEDGENHAYIGEILREIETSTLFGRITSVNVTDKFNLYAVCDEMYKLMLGDASDIQVKLDLGAKILEDHMFDGNVTRARIDLSDTKESSVIVDNQIDLD